MEGAFRPDTLIQTVLTHEPTSFGNVSTPLPATGFKHDGAGYLKVDLLLGILSATAAVQVTVQHADYDADGSPPEAGDFVNALDDAGNAIAFPAALGVADDQLVHMILVNCNRLKPWVRLLFAQSVGGQTALAAVKAEIIYVKYEELSDASLSAAALAANKSAGYAVRVP